MFLNILYPLLPYNEFVKIQISSFGLFLFMFGQFRTKISTSSGNDFCLILVKHVGYYVIFEQFLE